MMKCFCKTIYSHFFGQFLMPLPREGFGECICDHLCCFAVFQLDFAFFDAFPYKMILCINILCPCMVFRVLCECDCALVVFVDYVPINHICDSEIVLAREIG